ncbi:hypothetical protein BC831DRAFT_444144 [Entophlyctis helioformis]|nr:hypothetical protein BC831DRAFT_444144 [Entophlyctis helioformis]
MDPKRRMWRSSHCPAALVKAGSSRAWSSSLLASSYSRNSILRRRRKSAVAPRAFGVPLNVPSVNRRRISRRRSSFEATAEDDDEGGSSCGCCEAWTAAMARQPASMAAAISVDLVAPCILAAVHTALLTAWPSGDARLMAMASEASTMASTGASSDLDVSTSFSRKAASCSAADAAGAGATLEAEALSVVVMAETRLAVLPMWQLLVQCHSTMLVAK